MTVLVSTLVALACLFLIGYPLFKGASNESSVNTKSGKPGINHNKEILMSTLGEIEFDYRMNKLSNEDYHELKSNYSAAVAAIIIEQENADFKINKKSKRKPEGYVISEIEKEIEAELKALER